MHVKTYHPLSSFYNQVVWPFPELFCLASSISIDGSSRRSSCGLFWLSTLTISYRTQQVYGNPFIIFWNLDIGQEEVKKSLKVLHNFWLVSLFSSVFLLTSFGNQASYSFKIQKIPYVVVLVLRLQMTVFRKMMKMFLMRKTGWNNKWRKAMLIQMLLFNYKTFIRCILGQ